MQVAILVWILLFAFVAARFAVFLHTILGPDLVALGFGEGGDDAYYYFTIARNIAHGGGVTIDGEHWTTGFQPLWQLLISPAFLSGSDRTALAIIYVMSFACWFVGLALFLRFIARASPTPLTPAMTAFAAALFLCETQLSSNYFNGLDTGLYLTLFLGLLVAFQHHIASPAGGMGRLVGLGVLAGFTMLARNDAVFICAGLIALALLPGLRPRPIREGAVIVAVAGLLVVPWLAYCQWATGYPMPQSGVATSTAIYGDIAWPGLPRNLVATLVPTYFVKVATLIDILPLPLLFTLIAMVAALVIWWRMRDRDAAVERSSRLVLIAVAAACVPMVLYYVLVSSAGQFFPRYFTPIKLLVVIVLALFAIHALARLRLPRTAMAAIVAGALFTVGSNLYWIWRDFNLPWRSYIGYEAYHIARLPYGQDSSRIGTPESGRLGFLYPTRVVNLDGKMRVDALRAIQKHSVDTLIKSLDLDYVLLSDFYVGFFDKMSPAWRDGFTEVDRLGLFHVFANTAKPH